MAAMLAVCIAGLERSLNSSIGSYEKYILEPLSADAYYNVQTTIDRVAPLRKMLATRKQTVFVDVSAEVVPLVDMLKAGHENMTWYSHLVVRDVGQPYGALALWLRWKHCTRAIQAHEIARGSGYEFTAFARTDLHWYGMLPELRLFEEAATANCYSASKAVFVLEGEEYAGTNDRFFLLRRVQAHVVGGYMWDTIAHHEGLDRLFKTFRDTGMPLNPDQLFGIEILTNMLLLAAGTCILKFSSVAALLKPSDGHAKSFIEFASAKFFGEILDQGGSWDVIRSPVLVGGRCKDLPRHCCQNPHVGGYADCWYWFRDNGAVRLYSIIRCCDAFHVHIAPIPTAIIMRKAATYMHVYRGLGQSLDPQVTDRTVTPVYSRSERGVYCGQAHENVLGVFSPEGQRIEHAEGALAQCETYCWSSPTCIACSVYVVEGFPRWHAIPSCGNRIAFTGVIDGDISLKDHAQLLLQPRNNRHWFCSPFQPEDSMVFPFKPEKLEEIKAGSSPYDYMPIGSFQCYNVDYLMMTRYGSIIHG